MVRILFVLGFLIVANNSYGQEEWLVPESAKVVVNPFYVAIEVPGFNRRDLTP